MTTNIGTVSTRMKQAWAALCGAISPGNSNKSMSAGLSNLSTRMKQAWGALCIAIYCNEKGIRHPSIDQLIPQLLALLVAPCLPQWETNLCKLDLHGLGEPLPPDLETLLVPQTRNEFYELIENTVEIGMSDMWVANTSRPLEHALKCAEILKRNGIDPPAVDALFPSHEDDLGGDWGPEFSSDEYARVKVRFNRIFPLS